MEYPYSLTKEETIRRIEAFGISADLENQNFDVYDQLLACEAVAETEDTPQNHFQQIKQSNNQNKNVIVNGNDNDGCKRKVNFELTQSKRKVIEELEKRNYRTSPIKISKLLEELFVECNTKPGHWLYISQKYPPRRINFCIKKIVKSYETGFQSIYNPGALLTHLLKFRKPRKSASINGTSKQQL